MSTESKSESQILYRGYGIAVVNYWPPGITKGYWVDKDVSTDVYAKHCRDLSGKRAAHMWNAHDYDPAQQGYHLKQYNLVVLESELEPEENEWGVVCP